jgi:hypothetical protein
MPLGPGGVFAPVNDPSRKIVWVEEKARHSVGRSNAESKADAR